MAKRQARLHRTNESMLADLRRLLALEGRLSRGLIEQQPEMASPSQYAARFGGLAPAFAAVGYQSRDFSFLKERAPRGGHDKSELARQLTALLEQEGRLSRAVIDRSAGLPTARVYAWAFGGMLKAYAAIGYVPAAAHHAGPPAFWL
jgi:hypothetical protein